MKERGSALNRVITSANFPERPPATVTKVSVSPTFGWNPFSKTGSPRPLSVVLSEDSLTQSLIARLLSPAGFLTPPAAPSPTSTAAWRTPPAASRSASAAVRQMSPAAASVSGGLRNTASGSFASVSGGLSNTAGGFEASSVSGGLLNTATGEEASVTGGTGNTAGGQGTVVIGGQSSTDNDTNSIAPQPPFPN